MNAVKLEPSSIPILSLPSRSCWISWTQRILVLSVNQPRSVAPSRPHSGYSCKPHRPFTDPFQPLAHLVENAEPDVGSDEAFSNLTIRDAMKNMWSDAGVQKAVARGHEFALHDNLH